MTRDELEAAAFWESSVCLSCGEIVDGEEPCPACGATEAIPAESLIRVLVFLEAE